MVVQKTVNPITETIDTTDLLLGLALTVGESSLCRS